MENERILHLIIKPSLIEEQLASQHTIAFLYPQSPIAITVLVLLFLIFLPSKAVSQSQDTPITPDPTIANCTPQLLPLTPCAPFVQGVAQSPSPSCCYNLKQVYLQQPGCPCILLNDTNLSSFPINSTLALQLPALCHIQVKISACSASPMVQVTPRPVIMGLGLGQNAGRKFKAERLLVLLVTLAATLL
ncbi:hypothetical protein GH714_018163 [Hevea brasiliensis]|uniref:Bifunctional inhibitor/plant lipid transfer protein/seed storage helical domain-containing protein n=1 Tax=Hevea brasiliensis TaxID=3981 RepID=A0A6A6NI32_HEVBR|nr:hypothetical protein GH714_018163 [Hevea brasiliensis]